MNKQKDKRIKKIIIQEICLILSIDKEIGPFKYVAEILFGDADDGNLDRAVRFVIICLLFVFDPLAVLMLVAVNVSIKEYQRNKKLLNLNKEETLEQQIERLKKRNESLKDKERDYKAFVQKLGAKELSDLDADEIKVKLDQIYDWNEKKGKNEKDV